MRVFAINETEWIAAETQEEALEFGGIWPEEIEAGTSVEEIFEDEWDDEFEFISEVSDSDDDEQVLEKTTIRKLLAAATEFPCKIMTEMD